MSGRLTGCPPPWLPGSLSHFSVLWCLLPHLRSDFRRISVHQLFFLCEVLCPSGSQGRRGKSALSTLGRLPVPRGYGEGALACTSGSRHFTSRWKLARRAGRTHPQTRACRRCVMQYMLLNGQSRINIPRRSWRQPCTMPQRQPLPSDPFPSANPALTPNP